MRLRIKYPIYFYLLIAWLPAFSESLHGQDIKTTDTLLLKQRMNDSLTTVNLLQTAITMIKAGEDESALSVISKAEEIASSDEFLLIEAECQKLAGDIYSRRSDSWEEMLTSYLKAISIYNRTGNREKEAEITKIIADNYFSNGLYKKAALWYQQTFELYKELKSLNLAGLAELTATAWYNLPDDTLSLKWYNTALSYFETEGNVEGSIRCTRKIASLYAETGNYKEAEEKYLGLLDIYKSRNDSRNISLIYNNLGVIKYRQKELTAALNFFREAEKEQIKSEPDYYFLTDVSSNIAITLQAAGNQAEMMRNFSRALDYARKSERKDEQARIAHLLSLIYFNRGDNYHADLYCKECVESAGASGAYAIMQECYQTWSGVMEKSNDFIKALEYYEKYLNLRDSLNFEKRLAEQKEADRQNYFDQVEQRIKLDIAGEEISNLEMKTLRAESARRENELKLLLKQQELDRSERERLAQSLALERERFQLNRREQEVMALRQQQRIDSLELVQKRNEALVLEQNNRLLESEKQQQQLTIEKEKQIRRLATGLGVLMAVVAVMILVGLISTRRKNQQLAESKRKIEMINADLEQKNVEILSQKEIIEQKNQAITDSIQYAKRIQTAVLPPVDFLSEWGFESFILFRPKDIVSGDFYWGKRKDNKIIVAAADCTGHGVPGAFMSMLGNAFLDEIFNTTEVTDAASVLNLLRDEVITALKQKGVTGEARDGMDISLCIIDRERLKLNFAGANNPLYLVHNSQLIKIPCDKMPIGIHFTELIPFTNQYSDIQLNDVLYLFTDGYADQFGGEKGRKFMYKQFQALLLNNHHLPMEQQKNVLEKTFDDWKGNYEQVDDVLVIGIRI